MARYGRAYKDRIVARLLPPESSAVEEVSREVGVSVTTLERWRAEALADGSVSSNQRWTPVARLQAVIATATLDEATRSAWCREQGIYPAELEAWKQDAIAGLGDPRAASARTRRWPKQLPCWCRQKSSRRSSARTRTHDPSGRPPDPGA